MKKLLSFSVVLATAIGLFSLSACEGGGIPITIPQEIDQTFVIPASGDSTFTLTNIVTGNFDSLLAANGASRDNVSAVYIFGAKIGQIDSAGNIMENYFELDTISMLIGDVALPTTSDSVFAYIPYLGSTTLLGPDGLVLFTLENTEFDVIPYVTKPSYRFTLKGKSRAPITKDLYYRIKVKTNITVYM